MTIHSGIRAAHDADERQRLRALDALQVLDTPPEAVFDDLAWLAARMCDAPIGLVSLVDAERQWFKARCGLDIESTPRKEAFCNHAIRQDDLLEVPDALRDARFADLPLVRDAPRVRFYAGMPLPGPGGRPVGTLCVFDTRPRALADAQREALRRLARLVSESLELRREKLLSQSRERAVAGLLDALPDGVASCDADGRLTEFNAVAREWHGVDPRTAHPQGWAVPFDLEDGSGAKIADIRQTPLYRAARGERIRGQVVVIRRPGHPPRTVSCNAEPLRGIHGDPLGAVCTLHDITAQVRLSRLMEKMALTDELTGLPNRAAWFAELDRVVARARRSGHAIAILFIDLDDFKRINDTLGHAAGDEVLRRFGERLRRRCRRNDFVARLAGDEFVVCLDRSGTGTLDPSRVAENIRRAVSEPMAVDGRTLAIGCSIGIGWDEGPEFDAARLMERADRAMYAAKRSRARPASAPQPAA